MVFLEGVGIPGGVYKKLADDLFSREYFEGEGKGVGRQDGESLVVFEPQGQSEDNVFLVVDQDEPVAFLDAELYSL